MEHPKDIGDRSTLAIILALRQLGYSVLLPFGENTRHDLALERAQNVWLVQCKTGRLAGGAVQFRTASSYYHHPRPRAHAKHCHGQVDFFAVYCADTAGVYLIPISHFDVDSAASLRVAPCRNNQSKRIRLAADYEIGRIAIEGLRASSGA